MVWCLEFGWVLSVVGLLVLLAVGDPWSLSLWWLLLLLLLLHATCSKPEVFKRSISTPERDEFGRTRIMIRFARGTTDVNFKFQVADLGVSHMHALLSSARCG